MLSILIGNVILFIIFMSLFSILSTLLVYVISIAIGLGYPLIIYMYVDETLGLTLFFINLILGGSLLLYHRYNTKKISQW